MDVRKVHRTDSGFDCFKFLHGHVMAPLSVTDLNVKVFGVDWTKNMYVKRLPECFLMCFFSE